MDATTENPRAVLGDNNPPEPTEYEKLAAEANERIDTANRWLIERPEITDAEMADRAGGFKTQLGTTRKALDAARRAEKVPIEEQLKAIDSRYKSLLDLLDRAALVITGKITAYLQAQQRKQEELRRQQEAEARRKREEAEAASRKAAEEARRVGADALRAQQDAERKQREAEAAEKAAAEPVRAAIKGDFTTRAMSLRVTWKAEVADEAAALKHYGKNPYVRKAALAAALELADAEAKKVKDENMAPPGFRFVKLERAA